MAIKMVREPSETPNINNIDDIIPMRYAYGGQNGFVIGKGTEISNTVSGLNFTVNSGRLVLQGVECDIDATGVTITIDNIATKRYYTIYLEVNLGLNTATIKDEYDTATYPTIDAGDDLTENTTGVARLPLYQFTATSGIISEVNKIVESVKYINQNFIKNVKVDDASKVNNLEIKQDENRVLKIGDIIIPQLEILYDGNTIDIDSNSIILNKSLNNNDRLVFISNYGFIISTPIHIEQAAPSQPTDCNITYSYSQHFAAGQIQFISKQRQITILNPNTNPNIKINNDVQQGDMELNATINSSIEGKFIENFSFNVSKIYRLII